MMVGRIIAVGMAIYGIVLWVSPSRNFVAPVWRYVFEYLDRPIIAAGFVVVGGALAVWPQPATFALLSGWLLFMSMQIARASIVGDSAWPTAIPWATLTAVLVYVALSKRTYWKTPKP